MDSTLWCSSSVPCCGNIAGWKGAENGLFGSGRETGYSGVGRGRSIRPAPHSGLGGDEASSYLDKTKRNLPIMDLIINSADYEYRRYFCYKAHPHSLFKVEVLPGIVAEFGEPRSKLGSRRFMLTRLQIRKDRYQKHFADMFWKQFHVKYISSHTAGRKLPRIFKVKGNPAQLIKGGYVVICEPNTRGRDSFAFQNSYGYWIERFGATDVLASDSPSAQYAIKELLNKIASTPNLLKAIPKTDFRVFEQLVAEVFRGFGYEVILTKRTRDGGKDIIAILRQDGNETEKLLIECKHWNEKVSVEAVRNLIGVAVSEQYLPTGVILATTSKFTPDAKKLKINPTIAINLDLKDYEDILNWIGDYDAIRFTSDEIKRYITAKTAS